MHQKPNYCHDRLSYLLSGFNASEQEYIADDFGNAIAVAPMLHDPRIAVYINQSADICAIHHAES